MIIESWLVLLMQVAVCDLDYTCFHCCSACFSEHLVSCWYRVQTKADAVSYCSVYPAVRRHLRTDK